MCVCVCVPHLPPHSPPHSLDCPVAVVWQEEDDHKHVWTELRAVQHKRCRAHGGLEEALKPYVGVEVIPAPKPNAVVVVAAAAAAKRRGGGDETSRNWGGQEQGGDTQWEGRGLVKELKGNKGLVHWA